MPLIRVSAEQAFATRKNNPVAYWGTRSDGNRVEPVAKPQFQQTFTLEPGESIFTIGSCFAREVEEALMNRGFRIPVRELMRDPLFADLGSGILNNYGTPSIYNELSWAFDTTRPFVVEDNLIELKPGKFVDLHLSPSLPPADWEVVRLRREAIGRLMRLSAECRVLMVTLGLTEVWFDSATGYYLNEIPRPSVLRRHPGRFEFHVLSCDETVDFLEKALLLLRKARSNDLRVVLTVSPVPMSATHRAMDVIVANTYSKSTLRVVAEIICSKYEWVDYFPSYEWVMLSDRQIAWDADLVHVTRDIVALNVNRMLDRYLSKEDNELDSCRAKIRIGGALIADELAANALSKGREYAKSFFHEFQEWSLRSPAFALQQARFLLSEGDCRGVLTTLATVPSNWEPLIVGLIRAKAQLELGLASDAVATLAPLVHDKLRSQPTWELLVTAHAESGDSAAAIATTSRYLAAMGYNRAWGLLNLARALRKTDAARAAHYYKSIIEEFSDGDGWIQFEIAEFLTKQKMFDSAQKMLKHAKPGNADLEERFAVLRTLLVA